MFEIEERNQLITELEKALRQSGIRTAVVAAIVAALGITATVVAVKNGEFHVKKYEELLDESLEGEKKVRGLLALSELENSFLKTKAYVENDALKAQVTALELLQAQVTALELLQARLVSVNPEDIRDKLNSLSEEQRENIINKAFGD